MDISNLKKHLTLSALFAAGTIFSGTAFADNISTSEELATIIAAEGDRTGTLTTDITATANLGTLAGTQLTIDGGTNRYGISGRYGTDSHYEGITVNSGQKLFVENVGSWNGFAPAINTDVCAGAIDNLGSTTITDSSFSNNYARGRDYYYGGAIFNLEGTLNIIASTKDSVFSGNYAQRGGTRTNNDISNLYGTINLYAASEKTISFDGGIESDSENVNINVKGETDYDVAGTVLFETGSVNSSNKFTLGAGTLKIENGVTWTSNTLAMDGGTLDIRNAGTLNYDGGSLTLNEGANINIDISETGNDQIVFSNDAEFILNGGKITVDLNKSVSVGEEFEILTDFILGESSLDLSTLVVEVTNAPDYVLTASTIAGETAGTNSLLLTVAAIPEPSMFGLFAGLTALALVGTRRRRK